MKNTEQTFNAIAEKEMHQWGLEGFKNTYPTLFKAIMLSMEQHANQFKQPIAGGETVYRKVSVKERLPEPSISMITFFPRRNGKLITGKYNGEEFFTIGDKWYKEEIEFWLEETTIPLSVNMPSDNRIIKYLVDERYSPEESKAIGAFVTWLRSQ